MEKLKEAVWQTWLRQVKSGMGCGTPTEMVKEYGFTGPFAGLDNHFKNPLEIAGALENVQEKICMRCGNRWRDHFPGRMGGIDCP
jgi:hypothetical protein